MFKRSSFCNWEPPQCAEVDGLDTETIVIRNSTRPQFEVRFTSTEWKALIEGVKAGEFDLRPTV
jgi:hypothetical protein